MKKAHIKTELPGPKARALLARDALVVSPSYPRDYPFVMSHGRGAEIWDVDGNRFLDFAAGIAVCSTGHSHPAVVQAIKEAAERFIHISSDYWHEGQVRLAERLQDLAPMREPVMSFFAQSGTESVEAALKLARYVTGRSRFLGFLGGFHGRTMGSLSFTSSKYTQQKGFFPAMPGVTHVPYPNDYRPLFAGPDQGQAVLSYIEDTLFVHNVPAAEVAAVLIEPIQGEGGYLVPPDGFLAGLRALCDRHGILLIFDEVQSGIGRTGRMFAAQHFGVQPDIMTLAKGLGSGMPIGMVVAKRSIMQKWTRGAHGNTYGGNPVCCAAALATLDLVEKELCANAAKVGEYFMGRLDMLAKKHPIIGEIRGKGLMIGMELVTDRASKTPAKKLCDALITRAFHNGLILLSCGQSTVRFMPPLMIREADVDEAVELLDRTIDEVLADERPPSIGRSPMVEAVVFRITCTRPAVPPLAAIGLLLMLVVAAGPAAQAAEEKRLYIYNWTDFIGPDTIAKFEKLTGIKVVYDVYDAEETMEARLLAGGSGYDVVSASTDYFSREIKAGIYESLDKSKLPNWKNLDPRVLAIQSVYDPGNAHAVPYLHSMNGFAYNVDMVKARMPNAPVDSLDMLFKPEVVSKFADCGVTFLDSAEDTLQLALRYLGLDPNTNKREDFKAAEDLLLKVRPYVRSFDSSEYLNGLANREVCVAMSWSSDYAMSHARAKAVGVNVNLAFTVPKEGANETFSSMLIPDGAPHPEAAYQFINFILRPDIIAEITNAIYYGNDNIASRPLVDSRILRDETLYPTPGIEARLYRSAEVSAATERLRTRTWTRVKTDE